MRCSARHAILARQHQRAFNRLYFLSEAVHNGGEATLTMPATSHAYLPDCRPADFCRHSFPHACPLGTHTVCLPLTRLALGVAGEGMKNTKEQLMDEEARKYPCIYISLHNFFFFLFHFPFDFSCTLFVFLSLHHFPPLLTASRVVLLSLPFFFFIVLVMFLFSCESFWPVVIILHSKASHLGVTAQVFPFLPSPFSLAYFPVDIHFRNGKITRV